jgi:hypothetical protein
MLFVGALAVEVHSSANTTLETSSDSTAEFKYISAKQKSTVSSHTKINNLQKYEMEETFVLSTPELQHLELL